MKPNIPEFIEAYSRYYGYKKTESSDSDLLDDAYDALYKMEIENRRALHQLTQADYDQEAFNKVISSIELNGIVSFNMTTFWGKISEGITRNYVNREDMLVHELTLHYEESSLGKDSLDKFTNAFNCNSVGCIAGFAMAVAMDWNQPKWLTEDSRNYMNAFENIACNYLNIPHDVGRRIFYGDEASVWGFVRYYEPETYGSINWVNTDECDININDYDDQWLDESVDLASIDYKTAIDVLRRIANGEIIFKRENDFIPQYSKTRKK